MRKLGRIFRRALTVLLIVLFAAVLTFWVQTYSVPLNFGRLSVDVTSKTGTVIESRSGIFSFRGVLAVGSGQLTEPTEWYTEYPPRPPLKDFNFMGRDRYLADWLYGEYDDEFPFGFALELNGHGITGFASGKFISMPHWYLLLLTGCYPLMRMPRLSSIFPSRRIAVVYGTLLAAGFWIMWLEGFAAPCFLLLAAVGIAVGVLIFWRSGRRRALRARIEQGLCVNCGYDLRASPLRCPECGNAGQVQGKR